MRSLKFQFYQSSTDVHVKRVAKVVEGEEEAPHEAMLFTPRMESLGMVFSPGP